MAWSIKVKSTNEIILCLLKCIGRYYVDMIAIKLSLSKDNYVISKNINFPSVKKYIVFSAL